MIDLHSHILPGIDDGAQSIEDSVEMARVASDDGIKTIAATPHSTELPSGYSYQDLLTLLERLEEELIRRELKLKVVAGLENYISPEIIRRVEEGAAVTLNGTKYILVELPLQQYPAYTDQILFELQAKGLFPIIAHPERNIAIQRHNSLLEQLVRRGMLAQVTSASLTGVFGKETQKVAQYFVTRNLVHIIASDAHSAFSLRMPVLSPAVAVAAELVGEERARAMVKAIPEAILAGEPIQVEPPIPPKSKSFWKFWR